MTPRTLFQAASISKPISAIGVLLLVQKGLLSLDGNVNDKLKSWSVPESDLTRAQPVTARMLLNHTAGTTVHGFDGYESTDQLPSLIQVLNGAPPTNSARVP